MNGETLGSASQNNWIEISEPGRLYDKPVVSVIMMAYNHEAYLSEAIEGVIRQQVGFPIELIIGEDCSADGTLRIAKDYQARFPELIRIISHTRNVGASENLRTAISVCRGDYTSFCEGDDYWIDERKLATEIEIFASNPSITIVHGDHVFREDFWGRRFIYLPRGRYFAEKDKGRLKGDIRAGVMGQLITQTCTLTVPTRLLKKYLGSNESSFPGAFYDRAIVAFCSVHGSASYIDRPVAAYRIWGGSMMRSGEIGTFQINSVLFSFFQSFARLHPEFMSLYDDAEIVQRAKALYLKAVLYRQMRASMYLERYFSERAISTKDLRVRLFLYSNPMLALVFRAQFWALSIFRKLKSRFQIYLGRVERVSI